MIVPRSDDPWAEYDPESSGRDALMANSDANSIRIGKIPAIIATILMILGTGYYAFHIFPPGNAEPLLPSSYAIVRGMGNFHSDHITSPPFDAIFNITCPIWNRGCNDACSRNGHQITDQCLEENQ